MLVGGTTLRVMISFVWSYAKMIAQENIRRNFSGSVCGKHDAGS
jgi:hypothetical protein